MRKSRACPGILNADTSSPELWFAFGSAAMLTGGMEAQGGVFSLSLVAAEAEHLFRVY